MQPIAQTSPRFLFADCRTGWCNHAIWLACTGVIVVLGAVRTATDAEYALASLALFPILSIAWYGGQVQGLAAAALAAAMWLVADFATDRQFSGQWVPWANAGTRLVTYATVASLAARIRELLEHERERAVVDPLTGLCNIRAFLEEGQLEVERSRRYSRPLAVVFIDLDNFKKLNDTRGHRAGDLALKAVARALAGSVRATDRVGRVGGDEFAVLLTEAEYEAAMAAARKIARRAGEALDGFPPVTASVGVAWYPRARPSMTAMLDDADAMMYEAKRAGGKDLRSRRFADAEPDPSR